jgi:hypothetical protein
MISIVNGLRISATNLDALRSGGIVGTFSKTFLVPDRAFALYPDLQIENSDLVTVDLWAECKSCENIDITFDISKLSELTALPSEELESIFQQRASIFLLVLRVYKLPNSIQVQQQSTGNFIPLPEIVTISEKLPILDDEQFQQVQDRSKPLDLTIDLEPPSDSFGEDDNFIIINPNPLPPTPPIPPLTNSPDINDLSWIQTISTLGDRSIEEDKGSKSNYQAGTDFENIAKKGLEFLGFTIDEFHKGGAGGLDLFCSKPYPLTGECKAGKSVPSGTTEELLKLGGMRLGRERFLESKKLIVGAGKVSNDVITASHEWKVSIIKAITLQKLVELKAKYKGAVNLFEFKEYLKAGQIDNKIEDYIQKVEGEIKLRSYIVQTVKELQDADAEYPIPIEIRTHYNAKKQGSNLSLDFTKEILIELSSPLAGYLGRVKGNEGNSDRFYYLRDLPS